MDFLWKLCYILVYELWMHTINCEMFYDSRARHQKYLLNVETRKKIVSNLSRHGSRSELPNLKFFHVPYNHTPITPIHYVLWKVTGTGTTYRKIIINLKNKFRIITLFKKKFANSPICTNIHILETTLLSLCTLIILFDKMQIFL